MPADPTPEPTREQNPNPTAARRLLLTLALALAAAAGTVALGAFWALSGAPQMPFAGIVLIALIATLLVRRFGR